MTPEGRARRERRLATLVAGLLKRRQEALEQIRRGEILCYFLWPQDIEEHYRGRYVVGSRVNDH